MITVRDLPFIAGRFSIGDKIKVEKRWSSERSEIVKAEIVGKYPWFCEVEHNGMRWCIQWADIEIQGIVKT